MAWEHGILRFSCLSRAIRVGSVPLLAALLVAGPAPATAGPPREHVAEAFEAAQWAYLSSAGRALRQLGLRAAGGTPELAALVRRQQDLLELVSAREAAIAARAGDGEAESADAIVRLRGEIDSLRAEIAALDARLATDFPRYGDLAAPAPLALEEVRALLGEDESLLFFLTGREAVHIWAVSREASLWHRAFIPPDFLADEIAALRADLDPNAATRGARTLVEGMDGPRIAPFDRSTAHFLYTQLIEPVESVLAGTGHVFVVADGALSGLPLSVLVSERPTGADTDPAAMRATAWLARRFAFTTLPSVDSLSAIRSRPRQHGDGPRVAFRGIGAPVLGGRSVQAVADAAPEGSFFRGALADVAAVRNLPPLPQTGPELRRLAETLSAGEDGLLLGERATETAVKAADLSGVGVLAFATHGLLSGEMPGLAEPALVLTPPEVATVEDDGLLTASEVAGLNLSADWVLLSACNTAGSDGRPDAEGLSGLARAFLYAGARAILVSHWPVRDDAAARLTTGAIGALDAEAGIGRAEALRRAMMALMEDERDPSLAHPSAWAPFVVVGEGGT